VALFWVLFFSSHLPNSGQFSRSDVIRFLPEIYRGLLFHEPAEGSPSGWRYLPQRWDIALTAAFIVTAGVCLGRLALRALRLFAPLDTATRGALAGGIGLSLLSLLTLGLGLAGVLWQGLFAVLFLTLIAAEVLLTSRDAPQSAKSSPLSHKQAAGAAAEARAPIWLRRGVLAICFAFCACMALGAMIPTTDFDCKEYHLVGPKEYWQAGRVQFLPHNVYTSFPFLTEMLTLAGMTMRGDWQRGALIGQTALAAFAPLTALGAFALARRSGGPTAGWCAALAYLTTPWTYRTAIIPYTEGALACYVVLTLLAFFVWRERRSSGAASRLEACCTWPLALGFLAGSAISTKYPGLVSVAVPIGLAVLVAVMWDVRSLSVPDAPRARDAAGALLCYAGGVLLAFGPWMLKNFAETGNPVYPLAYGLFGGKDWDEELHQKWRHGHPTRLLTPGWGDVEGVLLANDWQSPLLFGLAPLALLQRRRRAVLGVALDAAVLLAGWYLLTHRIDRFWVPVNSLMAVLAGCGLGLIVSPDSRRDSYPALLSRLLISMLVLFALVYNFGFITTALCGHNAYLMDEAAARRNQLTPSIAILDALKLPVGSKVLFVGEAATFDADFPCAYCTVFDHNLLEDWTAKKVGPDDWALRPKQEILDNLQAQGITHVFVNWEEILRYRTTYGFTNYVSPARFEELERLGILSPVDLWPARQADSRLLPVCPWDGLDPGWRQEAERWAPSLKTTLAGEPALMQYQLFEVVSAAR
jgi:hypothetical protein